jgi:rod shape-determining protein MreD
MAGRSFDILLLGPVRLLAAMMPLLLAIGLVLLVNLPVSLTGRLLPAPVLALAAVYYWVLVRPDLMPPPAVFIVGLLEDVLSGGPPGLWAAGFLAAYLLADRQRETLAGLSGIGAILGFAGSMLVAAATAYCLAWAIYWRAAPLAPLFLETVITVLFYPLIALSMGWVQRHVIGPMRRHDESGFRDAIVRRQR